MIGRAVGRAVGEAVGSPVGGDGGGTPTPPVEIGVVGSQATDGGGNWGLQQDRAMGNTFTLPHVATLKTGHLYIIPASGSGSTPIKMAVYTNNAGAAGTLLAVSDPTTVSAAGWHAFAFHDEVINPQDIHIIAVSGPVGGAGWDMGSFNSGGQTAARIYAGTLSYANPPTTAPAPTTSYANGLAVNIEYEYTP